jgi:hypothetical protein
MLQAGDFLFANLGDGGHAVLVMGGTGVHAIALCLAVHRRAPESAAPAAA